MPLLVEELSQPGLSQRLVSGAIGIAGIKVSDSDRGAYLYIDTLLEKNAKKDLPRCEALVWIRL